MLSFLLFCFLLLNSSSCSCCGSCSNQINVMLKLFLFYLMLNCSCFVVLLTAVERVHVGKQSRSKDVAVKSGVVVSCHESSVSCHDVAVKSGVVSCFLSCIR